MPTPNVLIATQPKQQFFLPGTGATPASGAKLFTYAAGTTTKQNTYTDSTGMVPSANPIILDSNGQCTYWLDETLMYKLTLAPSTGRHLRPHSQRLSRDCALGYLHLQR